MGKATESASRRSEVERKKHAGWRPCPSCGKQVSSNGRNFFHHLKKCDPVYLARNPPPAPAPGHSSIGALASPVTPARSFSTIGSSAATLPAIPTVLSPLTPSRPAAPPLPGHGNPPPVSPQIQVSSRTFLDALVDQPATGAALASEPYQVTLSEEQYTSFVQQLCFLRTYDRTVDAAFDRLERACGGKWGAYNAEIFAEVAAIQRAQAVAPDRSPSQSVSPSSAGRFDTRQPSYEDPVTLGLSMPAANSLSRQNYSPTSRSCLPPASTAGASNLIAFARTAQGLENNSQDTHHRLDSHGSDALPPGQKSNPLQNRPDHHCEGQPVAAPGYTHSAAETAWKSSGTDCRQSPPIPKPGQSAAMPTSMSISNVLD